MRKETKEIIRKEYEEIYIAEDGTEFASEGECKKYEQTAEGVINIAFEKTKHGNRIKNVGVNMFTFDCDEDLFCVRIADENDLHCVNMWLKYHNVYTCGPLGFHDNAQIGHDAIGTIQVFRELDYNDCCLLGSIEQLNDYLHRELEELIAKLNEQKKEEE